MEEICPHKVKLHNQGDFWCASIFSVLSVIIGAPNLSKQSHLSQQVTCSGYRYQPSLSFLFVLQASHLCCVSNRTYSCLQVYNAKGGQSAWSQKEVLQYCSEAIHPGQSRHFKSAFTQQKPGLES